MPQSRIRLATCLHLCARVWHAIGLLNSTTAMPTRRERMASHVAEETTVIGGRTADSARVLTPAALDFVTRLHREFNPTRESLLRARAERHARIQAGEVLDFLPETASVREGDWRVAPAPKDLDDRRVEITGPVDRKM